MVSRQLARRAERAAQQRELLAARSRREPQFGARTATDAEEFDFAEDPEFDDAFAEAIEDDEALLEREPRRLVSGRPRPRPKPGARVKKEAQPSFLPPEDFELPPLHLLAEPKQKRREDQRSTRARSSRTRGCLKACSRISACAARSSTSAPARW